VQTLLETLENFRGCSGLELNKSKTEAMWLGRWATRKDTPFEFRWPENSVNAFGIHFSNNRSKCESLNFDNKLEDLENILNSWKRRKLTLLGKINIVKSLGLSKLQLYHYLKISAKGLIKPYWILCGITNHIQ